MPKLQRSTLKLNAQVRAFGGGEGVRTPDLRLAKPALCQTELRPQIHGGPG